MSYQKQHHHLDEQELEKECILGNTFNEALSLMHYDASGTYLQCIIMCLKHFIIIIISTHKYV